MIIGGITDEAGKSIDVQIKAAKELNWEYIELRSVGGTNISVVSPAEFEIITDKLKTNNIKVSCFSTDVANWGKSPLSENDHANSIKELKASIPKMEALSVKYLRGMSYKHVNIPDSEKEDFYKMVIIKVQELVDICKDAGIVYLHENCSNVFSQSYELIKRLIDSISGDNFKILFDTGNPASKLNQMGDKPYKYQDSWEFYQTVKDHTAFVHIKDVKRHGDDNFEYTFPGEGDAHVVKILTDLKKNNFDGFVSIEPHMVSVYHAQAAEINQEDMFNNFIEYGNKIKKIYQSI